MEILTGYGTLDDHAAARRLHNRLFSNDAPVSLDVELYIAGLWTRGWRLVGFAFLEPRKIGRHRCLFLSRLGVSRPYRRQGWASRLVSEVVEYARDQEGDWPVYTYARDDNPASLNALFKAGFRAFNPVGFKRNRKRGYTWMKFT